MQRITLLALVLLLVPVLAATEGQEHAIVEALRTLKQQSDEGDTTARGALQHLQAIDIVAYTNLHGGEAGRAEAAWRIGVFYHLSPHQDNATAARWFRMAAEKGHPAAQTAIGDFHRIGLGGIARDELAAVYWYRKSAEQGHLAGQRELGQAYLYGNGIPADEATGMRWLRMAAEGGDAQAAMMVGVQLLFEGKRDDDDYVAAIPWIRMAAQRGHAGAQQMLGDFYSNGQGGLAKDEITAMHWYRKSAEQGDTDAQAALGEGYALGEGTPENPIEAYAWLSIALAQGLGIKIAEPDAAKRANIDAFNREREARPRAIMDILRKTMSKRELAKAQELARRYWADYVLPFRDPLSQ